MNKKILKVSVIIITYNQEQYIAKCLDSIIDQKVNFEFEIIIGDDASTDRTGKIIEKYTDKYPGFISCISENKNVGLLRNYFRTIDKCQGKYIAQCAGDDYWIEENKLQLQVDFLEKNPNYGMVVTNHAVYIQNKNKLIADYSKRVYKKFIDYDYEYDKYLLDRSSIGACTVMFMKKMVDEYRKAVGVEQIFSWDIEDVPFYLYIMRFYKVRHLSMTTAVYRRLDNSASRFSEKKKWLDFVLRGYSVPLFFIEKFGSQPETLKKLQIKRQVILLNYAFDVRDIEIAQLSVNELKKMKTLSFKERFIYFGVKHNLTSIFKLVLNIYAIIRWKI